MIAGSGAAGSDGGEAGAEPKPETGEAAGKAEAEGLPLKRLRPGAWSAHYGDRMRGR